VKRKVSLADVLYEYLDQPQTEQETRERAQEKLSDKERKLLADLLGDETLRASSKRA
jgi:hypothetical protein